MAQRELPKADIAGLLGACGSGKTFHAKWLRDRFFYDIIGMGDILRVRRMEDADFPAEAKDCMDRRELVPDRYMLPIFSQYAKRLSPGKFKVFEGFPRNESQARVFVGATIPRGLSVMIIHLDISDDEAWQRIRGSKDRGDRTDESEEKVRRGLAIFRENLTAILQVFRDHGIPVKTIPSGPRKEVASAIQSALCLPQTDVG